MHSHRQTSVSLILRSFLLCGSVIAGTASAQNAPILQPGAPGQPTQPINSQQAIRIADTRYSPDDVRFLQDMITHHQQAIDMAALVKDRTNRREVINVARRIDASQADEMKFMRNWLRERGQPGPDPHAAHMMHSASGTADHSIMGMATPAQMTAMAAAKGVAFDRMFLERMIAHHQGAVTMAKKLLDRPGSAYDPVLFEFVNEVINDQKAEIKRMNALVPSLAEDRRSSLTAGFKDAGQAISNLKLIASLPMPTGFFDPANPAGLPPEKPAKKDDKAKKDA